jgi:hypothetical protein
MNRPTKPIRHQRGQVAIIVAIVIGLLIVVVGLVVDLGYLYTRKTELQNAADAAALAGAKELNGTRDGIIAAKNQAIALAEANGVDFGGNPVVIPDDEDIEEIEFGPTPDGPWTSYEAASANDAAAADKRFIKVDTSGFDLSTVQTWFMRVSQWGFGGIESTSTFGRAVAGPYISEMMPIAVCALDGSTGPNCSTTNCGYERGKSYQLGEVNPLGDGNFYWINPVATDNSPGACAQITGSDFIRPFMCQGVVSAQVAGSSRLLTRPGKASGPLLGALDSRFDDYPPQAQCDPATAPPDTNIRQYRFTDTDVKAWMSPEPTQQSSSVLSKVGIPPVITTDYNGVVWSYVSPPADIPVGNSFATGRTLVEANYPATGTPYSQTSGNFFQAPTHTGKPGRRILTLAIVQCPTAGGNCAEATVLARGKFLMQRKADVPTDKDIYVEFGGLVGPAGITADYKLYR